MDLSKVEADLSTEDFDVEKHASKLLMGQSSASEISEYVACLSEAERRIDHKLEDHVSTHYKDLLDQATSIERIEDQLAAVTAQSSALLISIEKARNRVAEPYNNIRNQTVSLGRIQETCDILRRIIRILQLGKKLQQQLAGGPADITKAAQSLSELAELWEPEKDMNLSGIQAIEGELRIFRHARTDVERSADLMLASGMETKSQNQMGVALQVYFNLNVLPTKIEQVVVNQIKDINASLVNGLDVKKINANIDEKKATPGGNIYINTSSINSNMAGSVLPGFRTQLWNNIENVLDLIYVKTSELMQLQMELCKKRDASQGASFAELLYQSEEQSEKTQVLPYFWSETLKVIKHCLVKGAASSSSIRQSFEGELPKLVRLFNDLWQRLCGAANSCLVSDPAITLPNPFHFESAEDIREILTDFERVYLSRSLSRLFDPINLMFDSSSRVMKKAGASSSMDSSKTSSIGQAPSTGETDAVLRVITSELSIASKVHDSNNRLWTSIAKNIAKTVRLMCNKCEELMAGGEGSGDSSQVIGYPTDDQRRNVKVINNLTSFSTQVEKVANIQEGNQECRDIILVSLKDVEKLSKLVLEPILDSTIDAIEAIILTMHQETHFSNNDETPVNKMSPYLRELKTFLHRVCNDFLQPFRCEQLVSDCAMPLLVKITALFVQHASMVRPLGRFGQQSLALDCEQLESLLEPLVDLVSRGNKKECAEQIEKSFKEVAAFKALLFTKPELVLEMPELANGSLRYSIALHFLFNRAHLDLKSPHESAGWSISRYSAWLEDHIEENDRLQLIQGALESYAAGTRIRREKSYVAPYPAMVQILQKAQDIHCKR